MKRILSVSILVLVLGACDRNNKPLIFTPNFASNSNIFGFDPLQGPVKSFTQTVIDEKGKMIADYHSDIDKNGCFTTINARIPRLITDIFLVKDGKYYVNAKTKDKVFVINDNCTISQSVSGNEKYLMNDKGFITEVQWIVLGMKVNHYDYDENGFPLTQFTYTKTMMMKSVNEFNTEADKPFNYASKGYDNGIHSHSLARDCTIDSHRNPISCRVEHTGPDGKLDNV
ncbi:YnfC family lipoprotein [Yersinia enterocolitica]|uniref:YnfC family lipoprotein n=1 Tax=Yersinia enterocolitica TaxID=630 RepID=UPI0038BC69FA|nr:YnfC family lipoprotein [Yersinia enterocolitica]